MRNIYRSTYRSMAYTGNDLSDFTPKAQCDISGFFVNHRDLRKQMAWAGNKLYWTGLLAHKDYVDEPNPFFKLPRVSRDPKPVKNARPNPTVMNGYF